MNFKQIVNDLADLYTLTYIAERAGVSLSYISRIASGDRKTINYEIGAALVEMHKRETKKGRIKR